MRKNKLHWAYIECIEFHYQLRAHSSSSVCEIALIAPSLSSRHTIHDDLVQLSAHITSFRESQEKEDSRLHSTWR